MSKVYLLMQPGDWEQSGEVLSVHRTIEGAKAAYTSRSKRNTWLQDEDGGWFFGFQPKRGFPTMEVEIKVMELQD
jgi:hypothetical protein